MPLIIKTDHQTLDRNPTLSQRSLTMGFLKEQEALLSLIQKLKLEVLVESQG